MIAAVRTREERFEFHKRPQLFIRAHNETLSITAMCVRNEDRSPARIHGCDAAPTPTGFTALARLMKVIIAASGGAYGTSLIRTRCATGPNAFDHKPNQRKPAADQKNS